MIPFLCPLNGTKVVKDLIIKYEYLIDDYAKDDGPGEA